MSRKVVYPQSVLNSIKKTDLVTASKDKILKFDEAKIAHKQDTGPKPWGLWYACGVEWLDYCQSEMPNRCYPYLFTLKVSKNVLKVRTLGQLFEFDKKYGRSSFDGVDKSDRYAQIDWARVTDEYSGIEICPYQHKARYELLWYYTWDVASGCIWRVDGLVSAERIL
jgi:hypothetical protein